MSSSSRSSIINTSNVQSQFTSLLRDRDNAQSTFRRAIQERQTVQSTIQSLRSKQASLSEKIHRAHSTLGTHTKRKQLLNQELNRLKYVMKQDYNEITSLTRQTSALESEEKQAKWDFVKNMEDVNYQLRDAVRRLDDLTLSKLLNRESCQYISQLVEEENKECLVSASLGEQTAVAPPQSVEDESLIEIWSKKQVYEKLMTSLALAEDAFDENQTVLDLQAQLNRKAYELRNQVRTQKVLGDLELHELEKMWEQQSSYTSSSSITHQHEDVSIGAPMELLESTKTQGQYQTQFHATDCDVQEEQQPLNMDLFYGNQSLVDEENLSEAAFRMDMEETPQE